MVPPIASRPLAVTIVAEPALPSVPPLQLNGPEIATGMLPCRVPLERTKDDGVTVPDPLKITVPPLTTSGPLAIVVLPPKTAVPVVKVFVPPT